MGPFAQRVTRHEILWRDSGRKSPAGVTSRWRQRQRPLPFCPMRTSTGRVIVSVKKERRPEMRSLVAVVTVAVIVMWAPGKLCADEPPAVVECIVVLKLTDE